MGADLITYAVAMPTKGVKKIAAKEINRIGKALDALDKEAILAHEKGWDLLVKALGIDGSLYENDFGEEDVERLWDSVVEDLELVEGFDEGFSARDCGSWNGTIGGKQVEILYAGDMSWGDSPDGLGYKTIGALWRLGIGDKLYDKVK